MTTCSSSYSLGDWVVIGVVARENAAEQIKQYQKFTVNISDETSMLAMGAGWFYQSSGEIGTFGSAL
ncbi:TPA: hypothetical protein VVS78_001200 [Streptococcus pneumoniae]|nr:hypothetical protein [Streptococcus pneumoniae]HEU1665903.1 hypothetical protein [Streptococcus pneumoniae]HEU3004696.1 hypothetical protein [Streptococcus pneumoniae]HEU3027672.1 hypothetical protein [Streptococcus pneumoniae]HEU6225197.1 hypothetical protein [Streptococcus pneumoniae]